MSFAKSISRATADGSFETSTAARIPAAGHRRLATNHKIAGFAPNCFIQISDSRSFLRGSKFVFGISCACALSLAHRSRNCLGKMDLNRRDAENAEKTYPAVLSALHTLCEVRLRLCRSALFASLRFNC